MIATILRRRALIPLWIMAFTLVWIATPDWEIATSGLVAATLIAGVTFSTMYLAWKTQPVPLPATTIVAREASDAVDLERLDSDRG